MNFEQDIKTCVGVLQEGGVILYPTDTIWGLGCDATNEEAVQRIFSIKKRNESKSMIILLAKENQLKNFTGFKKSLPDLGINKPLTVIYPGAKNLAKNLIAGDGSIAIRIVKEDFCKTLILSFGKPIVSTSANISGGETPKFYKEINDEIKNKVDYVVKYRQDDETANDPSAIVKWIDGSWEIKRK